MKMKIGGPRKISTTGSRSQLEDKPRKKKTRVDMSDVEDDTPKKKKKKTAQDLLSGVYPSKASKKNDEEKTTKKSSSREIALVKAKGTDITTKEKKLMKSYFKGSSDKIIEMLEAGDNDGGLTLLKKKLLQTVIRTLPAAEKVLVESETSKGTYQFVTLVSQIRELITDIQADRDRAYIAQSLLETIVRPAFLEIAQQMMTKHHEFRKTSEDYVNPKHAQSHSAALLALAKELAGEMNTAYRDLSVKLIEALKT